MQPRRPTPMLFAAPWLLLGLCPRPVCVVEGIADSPPPEGHSYLCTLGFSSRKAGGRLPVLFVAAFSAWLSKICQMNEGDPEGMSI